MDLFLLVSEAGRGIKKELIQDLSCLFESGRTLAPGPAWESRGWI